MTLNAVIVLILRFFSLNSIDFQAEYITVVEDRPIMSVKYVSQFQSSTFGQNYNVPGCAVSAIAEHLVIIMLETRFQFRYVQCRMHIYFA